MTTDVAAAGRGGDDDATQRFKDVMMGNERLLQENRMLQAYLHQHAPSSDGGSGENNNNNNAAAATAAAAQSSGGRRATANKSLNGRRNSDMMSLSELHLYAISEVSLRQLGTILREVEATACKQEADLEAMTGETKLRLNELKKEAVEFRRQITDNDGDRLLRWIEELVAMKVKTADKLALKNTSLKAKIAKKERLAEQKEEQGETLNAIDFHQLGIENSQVVQKIKERNDELLRLKATTGRTVCVLNNAKRHLNDIVTRGKTYRRHIHDREENLVRLIDDLRHVEDEVGVEKRRFDRLTALTSNSKMPAPMEYVQQKALEHQLQKKRENYQRKLDIAELALRQVSTAAAAAVI